MIRPFVLMALAVAATALVGCGLSPDELATRGARKIEESDIDGAMKDLTAAISKDASCVDAYLWRGVAYQHLEQYDKAMVDFDEAVRVAPDVARAYVPRVWLLAGSPDDSQRDGKRALADIKKAAELAGKPLEEYADCVAASYAAMGDFSAAIRWQQLVKKNSMHSADAEEAMARYRNGKPYRLFYWKEKN